MPAGSLKEESKAALVQIKQETGNENSQLFTPNPFERNNPSAKLFRFRTFLSQSANTGLYT